MAELARALTVAGSDSGGGAGIQADLKTFMALGVYGMTAITAVTAQNTLGVHGVWPLPPEAVAAQMDAVVTDIGVDALKTGMLAEIPMIAAVVDKIREHRLQPLVVDPVMVARGGDLLIADAARAYLARHLLPLATVATPNLREAEALTGREIRQRGDMEEAARRLLDLGCPAVVLKGGQLARRGEPAVDLLADGRGFEWLEADPLPARHTHGTGCTFSAAICACLARGWPLAEAVARAKAYVTAAIAGAPGLGQGYGPVNHLVRAE